MNILYEHSPQYNRLNSIGHHFGCVCERCFHLIERAINRYLPGLLPDEPADPRIAELEQDNRKQREEIHRLRTVLRSHETRREQNRIEKRGLDVEPR